MHQHRLLHVLHLLTTFKQYCWEHGAISCLDVLILRALMVPVSLLSVR